MSDDDLKKLKRTDLLNRLLAATRENEQLKAELAEARLQLADRQLGMLDAGSIAEASLKLNDVFSAAQAAADQYLDNIERLYRGRGELVHEAQSKAQALVAQAKLDAEAQMERVRIDARAEAEQVRAAANVAADEARGQARAARADADAARREAVRAREDAAAILRVAKDEAASLLERARADAAAQAEDIEADARAKADGILADARLKAQMRIDEAERVCRNFETATKVRCDNAMRRAVDEAHTYGNTMRMAMQVMGITPDMVPALEEATGQKAVPEEDAAPASVLSDQQPERGEDAQPEPEKPVRDVAAELDEAVSSARAAVAAALSNAKTAPGTLDEDNVAAMYPNSAEQL